MDVVACVYVFVALAVDRHSKLACVCDCVTSPSAGTCPYGDDPTQPYSVASLLAGSPLLKVPEVQALECVPSAAGLANPNGYSFQLGFR